MEATAEITAAVKNVPALRFPEFEGEWEKKVFNNIVKVIDCKHRTPPYVDEGIPVVSPGSINWGEIDLISPKKRVTEDEYQSLMDHCSPDIGDMVFSRNQSIGIASILYKKEKFVLGQDTVLIQAKKADPFFVYFRLQTHPIQSLISRLSGGSTFSRINLKDVRELKMFVSNSMAEQHKIGSFLTAVENKIQQLSQKKELLEKYKKGVMQQLFSQQIRFKDENGNDFPEWKIKKAKDVFINHSNKKHNGDLPILAITQDKGTVLRDSIDIDIKSSEASIKSYKIIEAGDFIISLRSFQGGIEYSDITGICSPAYTILKATIDIDTTFFKYYFKKESFIKQLSNTVVGIRDGKQISYDAFSGMKLLFPSVAEQAKIANFLTSIDNKINYTSKQLEQAQQFKKGLLQQMFV
ncbi:restriction endonuclease subunit S [Pontibacter pudoricolor]|uniref:restriction endonuclease subunit S n=1 Tax=Pontibacter pudoricolor TaxID=2694930 RepID=UPI001391D62D|nr:restriction endonuclease subunit S [Pontibacter pudoricolor]